MREKLMSSRQAIKGCKPVLILAYKILTLFFLEYDTENFHTSLLIFFLRLIHDFFTHIFFIPWFKISTRSSYLRRIRLLTWYVWKLVLPCILLHPREICPFYPYPCSNLSSANVVTLKKDQVSYVSTNPPVKTKQIGTIQKNQYNSNL